MMSLIRRFHSTAKSRHSRVTLALQMSACTTFAKPLSLCMSGAPTNFDSRTTGRCPNTVTVPGQWLIHRLCSTSAHHAGCLQHTHCRMDPCKHVFKVTSKELSLRETLNKYQCPSNDTFHFFTTK